MKQQNRTSNRASGGRDQTASNAGNEQLQADNERPRDARPSTALTVVPFDFKGHVVRTIIKEGQVWFVSSDVCAGFEHSNPREAVARLDDDEKGVTIVDTLGGDQEVTVINESGLYHLILRSRKPQAKAFRRWVTSEVLPSIRRTGRYEAQAEPTPPLLDGGVVQVQVGANGRFVITKLRGKPPHVHETNFEAVLLDGTATDCQILSHQLKLITLFWDKVQHMRSINAELEDGFAFTKLETAILEGDRLARRYLRLYEKYPGKEETS